MNKQQNLSKLTFFQWIHRHRVKLGIWMFLIVLPVALIFTAYVGSYTSNKSVYFDSEITSESVKIKKFVTVEDLKAVSLNIEWDALKRPSLDENDELKGGNYRFIMSYKAKENYQTESVKITPVLQTDWKSYRSVGAERTLSVNDSLVNISFDYELPKSPLLFVTIKDPNLYLRVTVVYKSAGQSITEVEYVKFPLNNLNPRTVESN